MALTDEWFFPNLENKNNVLQAIEKIVLHMLDFLNAKASDHLHSPASPKEIAALFSSSHVPVEGQGLWPTVDEALRDIVAHSVRVGHPRYIGHMTGAVPWFSLIGDLIISSLNQNLVKIETALSGTYVEWQTLAWLHRLVYQQDDDFYQNILGQAEFSLGNMCSGGTMGNLTALATALNYAFPHCRAKGLAFSYREAHVERAVIITSARGHYSLKKSAFVLGLGEENLVVVPCEPFTNKIDVSALKQTIQTLLKEKTKIVAVVGVAGSTETGSIDDLEALGNLAAQYGIWFHVDAAWGGALLLSDQHKYQLSGIEKADSVVLDGHKLFYLNMSHGAVLFKNKRSLDVLRHNARYIIREGSVDLGRTTLEGSRRFDSFKLWFSLKILGQKGYAALLEQSLQLAQEFSQMINDHPRFVLTSACQTNILTYRFLPRGIDKKRFDSRDAQFMVLNEKINSINKDLQKMQRDAGRSFVSRTILESVFPGYETVVLRAIPFHPTTTKHCLEDILGEQCKLGESLPFL